MPIATYKDLCIDAVDPAAQGAFWGPLLGWRAETMDNGDCCLREAGDQSRVQVWINGVPEPLAGKNRLHLDINAHSVQAVVDAGGTVIDDQSFSWTVMRDPDGQLFCVFVRDRSTPVGPYELAWDVTGGVQDCRSLATWWAELLGGELTHEDDYSWIGRVPRSPFQAMTFAPVPEPKTVKNRIHIDVLVDDLDALMAAGATRLRIKGDGGIGWHVMADPAGNEFCAFTRD
ncbi:MAG TPA: VOC family protein [Nakamurella sp.]|nr:VOC family protein [Nakamurella sp.]